MELLQRENMYLSKFKPILNVLTNNTTDSRRSSIISLLTKSKISRSLKGRIDTEVTRTKKSESRIGILNPFFGKGPGLKALDIAAEKLGIKVYVYKAQSFTLVEGSPFHSIRATTKMIPISNSTLPLKLDLGKPFKGYYYYTKPQTQLPK